MVRTVRWVSMTPLVAPSGCGSGDEAPTATNDAAGVVAEERSGRPGSGSGAAEERIGIARTTAGRDGIDYGAQRVVEDGRQRVATRSYGGKPSDRKWVSRIGRCSGRAAREVAANWPAGLR